MHPFSTSMTITVSLRSRSNFIVLSREDHHRVRRLTLNPLHTLFIFPPHTFSRSMAESSSHRSKHLDERMRLRILDMVERDHHTHTEVARALGVHRNTIRNTIQHFHREGHLHDSHAGGHRESWDWKEQEALWDLITVEPHLTAAALRRRLCPPAALTSTRTIARYRRILDFTPRTARTQARGAIGHHEERADWAWEHRRSPITRWLHSDESTLVMRDTGEIMWAPKGDPSPRHEITNIRHAIHLFGVVWDGGCAFGQYFGHLTAVKYIALLTEHILPQQENIGQRTFLMDRHTSHTAKLTAAWLKTKDLDVAILPTHSPQFNAIEECWAWIKHKVKDQAPHTPDDLESAVQSACDILPQSIIDAYLQHAQANVREYAHAFRGL